MQVRILPVLILFAVLTLGVRVGEIWEGFGGVAVAEGDAASSADFVSDPFADVSPDQRQLAENDAKQETTAAQATDAGTSGAGTANMAAADATASDFPAGADPLSMSDEEIELLQQLAARRKGLDRRAEMLDRREATIQAAEKRLDDKVAELERLRKEIKALLVDYDDQEKEQVERLVRIYEKMKPKDAARIFEDLEMDVLLKVVERMNERATAPILAEMRSDKAQELTLELAAREALPLPRE